jgi:hypothetical protein
MSRNPVSPSVLFATLLLSSPFAAEATAQTVSFIESKDFAVGVRPVSVAVGDFDGDGVPDLAVAREGIISIGDPGDVSVALGNGDGTFQAARSFAAGSQPRSVAVGDFNLDEVADLAVANRGGVSVLLGNGDGTFQTAQTYAAGALPEFVAVGEFNHDGVLDLAVANASSDNVSVLLGSADGTFQAARTFAAGRNPRSIAISDFNGDGVPDLATANVGVPTSVRGHVSVLLGNGDGTFQAPRNFAAGFNPRSVAVGDFNGDGRMDLVAANFLLTNVLGTVSILLGNGDGTFQTHQEFASHASSGNPMSVAVGDLNGDGKPDVVVAQLGSTPARNVRVVSVLLGNGDGTLQAPQTYFSGSSTCVVIADFNGDGVPDLAVADGVYNLVRLMLGNGDGTLQAVRTFGPGGFRVAVGDVNGDGVPDLAVIRPGAVLLGNGDGTFQAPLTFTVGCVLVDVAGGDFNGDGLRDLAVACEGNFANGDPGHVALMLGNGDGTFQPARGLTAGSVLAVGDFNGDAFSDLAVANSNQDTVTVLLSNGDGTFQAPLTFAAGAYPYFVAVSDFNTDGNVDLAVADLGYNTCSPECSSTSSGVSVLLGNGDGTFEPAFMIDRTDWTRHVAAGDFNGDRLPDLAIVNSSPSNVVHVVVRLGNGDGTFQAPVAFAVQHAFSVTVAEFNGDGALDLAVSKSEGIEVLLGNGDGTFQMPQSFRTDAAYSAGVADFNGDGKLDLVTNQVEVLINNTAFATYTLALDKDGNGSGTVTSTSTPASATQIDCGTVCTATYYGATQVTLTASADVGSTFAGWTGCDTVSDTTCTVTMSEAKSVVATFTLQQFALTVTKEGIGRGTVTSSSDPAGSTQIDCGTACSASFDWGTVVTLTATPGFANRFFGWSGCDTASGATCTITIRADGAVTATFYGLPFDLPPRAQLPRIERTSALLLQRRAR